ncbi:Helicase associated domain protein, partial [Streptomyces sp. IBSBF 3136]|uniref:Helicase associated domain protein n=1 Tax=Streptomyces sp. IBSBF 3136 TaxID=2903524 RepID=UPI002FDC5915
MAVARVLASPRWQQQTLTQARGHLPYRLGEMPALLAELACRLQRPWLARHLATITHGPLFAWAHSLVRAHTAKAPADRKALWTVHSAHRPRPLSDLLARPATAGGTPPAPGPAKRLRGHSLQAERAFTQGLTHARAYYEEHQHLAVPKEDTPAGYPLGQWLANTRTRHTRMPAHQAAALTGLYAWWNAPWSTLWQRTWHQARTHTQTHGPLKAARGFPTTSLSLGEWLYLQCTCYPTLHPEQQRLLAQIGIDAAAAAAARPRRRNLKAGAEEALAHARSYAAEHGSLTTMTSATVHEGFRLGQWLANQRQYQRTGYRPLPADRAHALATIDPWWNPPWNLHWQRGYHRARTAASGHILKAENGFHALDDPGAADWLWRQCTTYDELHDAQRRLLAEIGLTPHVARTAQDHARTASKRPTAPQAPKKPASPARKKPASPARKRPAAPAAPDGEDKAGHARQAADPAPPTARRPTRRAAEPKRPREPRSRLGHRPDLRPGFDTALAHARAWHAEHGHLAVPRDTRHDGYPLGWWLFSQRNRAKTRAHRGLPPSPHLTELAAIDAWWNPPWNTEWQRNYHRVLTHIAAGEPFDPDTRIPAPNTVIGSWITRACLQYHQLHPGQQRLLNTIGITAQTTEQWPPSP